MNPKSLQEVYAPSSECFGCGPKNDKGLRIRSFAEGDDVCVCLWRPQPHHLAFTGVLNGGICGTLLDCHSNWTAAWHLMHRASRMLERSERAVADEASRMLERSERAVANVDVPTPPCTVTAEFAVKLARPTPLESELLIRAQVVEAEVDRATVEAKIEANGKVTATCRGIFVAVKEGHPAFHRW